MPVTHKEGLYTIPTPYSPWRWRQHDPPKPW